MWGVPGQGEQEAWAPSSGGSRENSPGRPQWLLILFFSLQKSKAHLQDTRPSGEDQLVTSMQALMAQDWGTKVRAVLQNKATIPVARAQSSMGGGPQRGILRKSHMSCPKRGRGMGETKKCESLV
jgi:hypothetical protein